MSRRASLALAIFVLAGAAALWFGGGSTNESPARDGSRSEGGGPDVVLIVVCPRSASRSVVPTRPALQLDPPAALRFEMAVVQVAHRRDETQRPGGADIRPR